MMWAKQSTAATLIVGPVLDSAGAEYASAVIGDLSISKNGGTLTAMAAAATLTYIANGQYTLVTTTGNLDTLGRAQITCNKSTYQMPPVNLMVLPATVFDALVTNAVNATGGLTGATGAITGLAGVIATTTNITAGTITTTTDLTNLPTIPANWITAAGITDSAFTAAKFDTACLTDAKFATGAITATVVADGFITNAKFAAGAIDNAAIAADAIGSSELAATAVAEIADQVWDEILSGHAVSGSTGEALNAAGGAGDPWITALPGAYGAGSAGYILGTNLNTTVSSRASQASLDTVDDILDTEIAALTTNLALLYNTVVVKAGTITTGATTTTTFFSSDLALFPSGGLIDAVIVMLTGTVKGQGRVISAYNDGTGQITVSEAFTSAPIVGETFAIMASHVHSIADIQSGMATAANLATVAGYLDTEIAAILADTNELQTDWANGGRLDLILDTAAADALKAADRSGYVLALAGGAIANPQTATETFVVTTGGNTFTVTGSGITSTGGRSAPTLAKT